MRVLVTGAGGFVGRTLCRELLQQGHEVVGALRTGEVVEESARAGLDGARWIGFELGSTVSIEAALDHRPDAVIHLAAVASGAEARRDPLTAWATNAMGTCALVYEIERLRPARATEPVRPCLTALITGVTGQDGSYLAELLLGKGYDDWWVWSAVPATTVTNGSSTCWTGWRSLPPTLLDQRCPFDRSPAGTSSPTRSITCDPTQSSCPPPGRSRC